MLSSFGKLEIVVLIFFTLGLPVAAWVCKKQGFGRQAGWFFLLILSVVRILGSALRLAYEQTNPPNNGLFIAATIVNNLGLIPLLFALMGLIQRVNDSSSHKKVSDKGFGLVKLIATVAIVLSIVSASKSSSSDPASLDSATTYRKVAAVLFFVATLLVIFATLYITLNFHRVWAGDRPIAICSSASTPFFLVRVIYLLIVAFAGSGSVFWYRNINIFVQAFMSYFPEFIIFGLLCFAGVRSDSIKGRLSNHQGAAAQGQPKNHDSYASQGQQELGRIGHRP